MRSTADLDIGVEDSRLELGAIAPSSGPLRLLMDKEAAKTSPYARNGSGETAVAVSASGDQGIDGLLAGTRWADGSITYSDPDTSDDYGPDYWSDADFDWLSAQFDGFSQLTDEQLRVVHSALNDFQYSQLAAATGLSVEAFTNLGIDYAGSGGGSGTIRVANSSDPAPPGNTAYAYFPSDDILGGDAS